MKRILTTLALVPFALYTIYLGPAWCFLGVVLLMAMLCYWEYAALVRAFGNPDHRVAGSVTGSVIILLPQVWPLLAILSLLLFMRGDLRRSLPGAGAFALGLLYIFGAWRCAVDLRAIDPNWLLFALAITWVGDIAALYIGRTFGKHKLAPLVSPGKSWEGAAGSVGAALLFGYVFAVYLHPGVPIGIVIALAAFANIAGQIGDLAESALKRGAGVKDSGTLLPGHGGFLDRLDSSLFTMPVVLTLLHVLALR